MKHMNKLLLGALSLPLGAGLASANAFNINEHDARASGRANATAATNTTASSVIFNPGGIAVSEGVQASIGTGVYFASGSYEDMAGNKTDTDSDPSVVPNLYATARVNDLVGVGVGFHLPFGLAVSWPDGHAQSDVIQDQTLRTYYITAAVGLNLNQYVPGLSLGGGIDLVPATVELENTLNFGEVRGTARLGGDAFGVGARAGIMYAPPKVKQLHIGVMYRSPVSLDFSGKGDFDIEAPFRDQLPPDGDISTSITLPQSVWGGIAVDPIPQLQIEANVVWMDWSAFQTLAINLPDGSQTVSPQNYEDKVTFRVGAEYKIGKSGAVRAGFVYDPTPIPPETLTARLPDIDRKNVSLGGSYGFGNYGVHAGLLWVTPGERETSQEPFMPAFKGTYGVQALVASLMFSGHFGGAGSR